MEGLGCWPTPISEHLDQLRRWWDVRVACRAAMVPVPVYIEFLTRRLEAKISDALWC